MEVRRRTTARCCWQWQVMAVRAEAGGTGKRQGERWAWWKVIVVSSMR